MWNKNNPSWWWCRLKSTSSAWMAVYSDGEYGIWDQANSTDPVRVFSGVEQDMDKAVELVERVAKNKGYKKL